MNSRIICGLKHDALLSGIHLIDAKRSLLTVTLSSYPVSHEEGLIGFATKHSIHTLRCGRLRLSTSEILASLLSKVINKRAVGHCVLVALTFEVDHIAQLSLSGGLSPFLICSLVVHTILVLLRQIIVEVILSLKRSRFGF